MKRPLGLALLLAASSCSGVTVTKNPPPPEQKSKPGVTWGKNPVGPVQVQKVGYWCDARNGMMTFGAFGATEAEATASAQKSCHGMFKDAACAATCKPASDTPSGLQKR